MRSKTLVAALVIAAGVTAGTASAHTLSKASAKREAAEVGGPLSKAVGGLPVYDCDRRSAHAFLCRISVVAAEGDLCLTTVRVAYRRHSSRRPSHRVVSGPTCEPPELIDLDR